MSTLGPSDLVGLSLLLLYFEQDKLDETSKPEILHVAYDLIQNEELVSNEVFLSRLSEGSVLMQLVTLLDALSSVEDLQPYLQECLKVVRIGDTVKSSSFLGNYIRFCSLRTKRMTFIQAQKLMGEWTPYYATIRACLVSSATGHSQNELKSDATFRQKIMVKERDQVYLAAWERGDYAVAINELHRHFDYGQSSQQDALLNMALLQADFGHHREALWAICEALDAAREGRNDQCLNAALAWIQESCSRDTNTVNLDRLKTTEPPMASHLHRDSSLRQYLDSSVAGSVVTHFLAMAQLWQEVDLIQLALLSLRIALTHCDNRTAPDVNAQIYFEMVNLLWSLGEYANAKVVLVSVPDSLLKSHKTHTLWKTQHAMIRLAEGAGTSVDIALETGQLKRDPFSIKPRILRLISLERLEEAMTCLQTYLEVFLPQQPSTTRAGSKYHIVYQQMLALIYAASSEPARAIVPAAKAAQLSHKHGLYMSYKESIDILRGVEVN